MHTQGWWLQLAFALSMVVVIFGVPTLIFAFFWHQYFKAKGTNKKYDWYVHGHQNYHEHLFSRAGMSTMALACLGVVFLVISMIGASITAKRADAEIRITVDTTYDVGLYSKVARDELPKDARHYLKKDDLIFVQNPTDKSRFRKVLRVDDHILRLLLEPVRQVRIVEVRWIERYPSKPFRWMGPDFKSEYVIADSGGNRMVATGFVFQNVLKR